MEASFNASVGRLGNSYDNALTETSNGAEVVRKNGPWKGLGASHIDLGGVV